MEIIGNYIEKVKCESFLDIATNRIRIRPIDNENFSTELVIECLKIYRDTSKYPIGTIFIAENVKVCKKTNGRVYLRAKDQLLIPA